MRKHAMVVLAVLLGMASFARGGTSYVRNGGDDAWDGQSWGTAWATIGQKRVDMGAYERPSYLTGSFMIVK